MKLIKENLELHRDTPYMLRNDGEIFQVKYELPKFPIDHPYIIYYKDHPIDECIVSAVEERLPDLYWFYQNTAKEMTRVGISRFIKLFLDNKEYFLKGRKLSRYILDRVNLFIPYDTPYVISTGGPRETYEALLHIDDAANQEFLRFRTGGSPYNKNKLGVYFRVSSKGFDWSDLIAKVIRDHYYKLDNISISKDQIALGIYDNYRINGETISCMRLEDIDLKNLPFIESLFCLRDGLPLGNYLKQGKTLLECLWSSSPWKLTERIIKKDKF